MSEHLRDVRELLAATLEVSPEAIDPDADLFSDLGVDSLRLFSIVITLEERHGVQFQEDHFHTLATARLVAAYLSALILACRSATTTIEERI